MRNGEIIYWRERLDVENAEVDTYGEAESFVLRNQSIFNAVGMTVQPKNGFTDRMSYGETTQSDQRVILTPYRYWHNKFKEGDIFYLNGKTPSGEEWAGEHANYYVEYVANQSEAIELSLKQIKNN